jgi:hypothetical protein
MGIASEVNAWGRRISCLTKVWHCPLRRRALYRGTRVCLFVFVCVKNSLGPCEQGRRRAKFFHTEAGLRAQATVRARLMQPFQGCRG